MTVSCPDCRSVFRVDPAKVPASGVRARCSVCGGIIAISGGTLPVMVTPASAGVVQSAFATPSESSPAIPAPTRASAPAIAAVAHRVPTPISQPAVATPLPPSVPTPVAPRAPITPSAPSIAAQAGGPSFAPPAFGSTAGTMTPPAPQQVSAPPATVPSVLSPASTAGPSPTPSAGSDTARRPINPFLKADPGQRARRLARALVSDLVAYHPQKRDEGIRNGTLRQLFRDEIKKSYEEYVEQVGRELAEASPHFQEALNDILGGGKKLF